jgi:hypothetical protein
MPVTVRKEFTAFRFKECEDNFKTAE